MSVTTVQFEQVQVHSDSVVEREKLIRGLRDAFAIPWNGQDPCTIALLQWRERGLALLEKGDLKTCKEELEAIFRRDAFLGMDAHDPQYCTSIDGVPMRAPFMMERNVLENYQTLSFAIFEPHLLALALLDQRDAWNDLLVQEEPPEKSIAETGFLQEMANASLDLPLLVEAVDDFVLRIEAEEEKKWQEAFEEKKVRAREEEAKQRKLLAEIQENSHREMEILSYQLQEEKTKLQALRTERHTLGERLSGAHNQLCQNRADVGRLNQEVHEALLAYQEFLRRR